jgi:hypothetical protein
MKKIFILFTGFPVILLSQTHSIDTMNLEMIGTTSFNNISSNTYYNTNDTCDVSWNVVDISIPANWEFSFCFPGCYNIGQASGQENFIPNEQIYLGCHFYPNGIAGFGTIKLEIITNVIFKDTVTWEGTINTLTSIDEENLFENTKINKIYDVFGRIIKSTQTNQPLFYIYDDGTVEKRIVIE